MTVYDDLFEQRGRTVTIVVTPKDVRATLRIFHHNLVPSDLTAIFGVSCTSSHIRGEQRIGKNGRKYPPFSKGAWLRSTENVVKSQSADVHIQALLDDMANCAGAMRKLQDLGYSTDITVYWFANCDNTCPTLSAETIRRLSVFRLSCWFDVYL